MFTILLILAVGVDWIIADFNLQKNLYFQWTAPAEAEGRSANQWQQISESLQSMRVQ